MYHNSCPIKQLWGNRRVVDSGNLALQKEMIDRGLVQI